MVLALCGILSVVGLRHIMPRTDAILTRRQHDIDPTRHMKHLNPRYDIPLTKEEAGVKSANPSSQNDGIKHGLITFGFFFILVSFGYMFSVKNPSQVVGLLISDRGFLPPIVLIVMFILLLRMHYNYPYAPVDNGREESSQTMVLLLRALQILTGIGIIITVFPVPGVGIWCYAISIAMLALLITKLIMLNRMNNEFVTRPVPILGKEAKS